MSNQEQAIRYDDFVQAINQSFSKGLTILDEELFAFEISKEVSRSNRRSFGKEFAIVVFPKITALHPSAVEAICLIFDRLRISDSIGWWQKKLAVLLPETNRLGASQLAAVLTSMIRNTESIDPGLIDFDVTIYPWDDQLISLSTELDATDLVVSEFHLEDAEFNDDGDVNGEQRPTSFSSFESNYSNGGTLTRSVKATGTRRNADRLTRLESRLARVIPQRKTPLSKRCIDLFGAGIGLTVLSPALIGVAVAIKLTSPGPVFFRQKREGKDGKAFSILKFRSMVEGAEDMQSRLREFSEQDGPAFKLKKDPRVTWLGKILRKSGIDELPQLINVLIGQMSLVGPRPLPVRESLECRTWQRKRLTVLPGITCIWQASGRKKNIPFDEWMRMDLDYIAQQSTMLDLKLLFRTAWIAILHRGSV